MEEDYRSPLAHYFKARDLKELLTKDFPPLEEFISPRVLWRGGKMLLAAPKKSGKSTFVQQLALALTHNIKFFAPLYIPHKLKVLYMQMEMHEQIVQERGVPTGIVPNAGDIIVCSRPPLKLDNPDSLKLFKLFLTEIRPDVLILDPLYMLHNQDENSAGEMQKVLDAIDSLIIEFDLGVILVHHHRKDSQLDGDDPTQKIRGTSKFTDWADTTVTIKKTANDTRTLFFEQRRADRQSPEITLKYNFDTLMYEVIGSQVDEEQYVLDSLPILRSELIESMMQDLDMEEVKIANCLKRLRRNNKISYEREGNRESTIIPWNGE